MPVQSHIGVNGGGQGGGGGGRVGQTRHTAAEQGIAGSHVVPVQSHSRVGRGREGWGDRSDAMQATKGG